VRVRKATTNTWVVADYSLVLDRGDYVQTADGIAKVVFTDGSNYTIKPDSLIAIQENSVNGQQQTKVSVQVTTGTVAATTTVLASGSKSQVVVGGTGATATLNSETTAEVINDPRADEHTVMVKKGSGEIARDGKTLPLEEYSKVSIPSGKGEMVKTKELRPPILISPPPNQNVFLDPATKGVNFSWSPVDNVREYHLKISRNPTFTDLVVNDRKPATQVLVTNLPEGVYYWQVLSIGQDGKESSESEQPRFTVAPKGSGTLALDLDYIQLGHVIEVKGKTEPNARVMVNGQEAVVGGDGTFHHFTNPLPTGENVITVTAQNAQGGVNTVTKQVVIQ